MTKYKLEYIWLDGYTPSPNLRGKTQIKEFDAFPTLEQLPMWGFDGVSTMQAVKATTQTACLKTGGAVSGQSERQEWRPRHVRSHDA